MTNTNIRAAIIVASSLNGIIGDSTKNATPWQGQLPADMTYFQEVTLGAPVIVGRKTYESFPPQLAPLKGRVNIIVSRDEAYDPRHHSERDDYKDDEVFTVTSLEAAFEMCRQKSWLEPFIIGGGEIYRQALVGLMVTTIYLTVVEQEFEGDIVFPNISESKHWKLISSWGHQPYDNNLLPFRWEIYERIK